MLMNGCRNIIFILLNVLIFTVLPVSANQPFLENWSTTPALPNSWEKDFSGDVQQWVDTTNNELHMVVRPYIPTSGQSRARASFRDPSVVASISTTITIKKINYASGMVDTSAQISGIFYNKNEVKPDDALGDVFASLRVGDRGNGQLEAWLSVSESLDSAFVTGSDLPSVQLANNLSLDTPYTVTFSFDGDRTFTGTISGGGLSGTPIDILGPERIGAGSPGFYDFKELRTRVYSGSGLTSNPDTNELRAAFGPVAINGGAEGSYDPLEKPLQFALWREPEGMATVTGSELKLQVESADTEPLNQRIQTQVNLPRDYDAYTYIQADLRIDKKPIRTESQAQVTLKKNWGNGLREEILGFPEWAGTISSYAQISKGAGVDSYDVGCALEMDDPSNEVSSEGYVGIFGDWAPALPDTVYTFSLFRVGTTISCTIKEKSSGKILVDLSENVLNTTGIDNFYDVSHSQLNRVRVRARGEHPSETIGYFDNICVGTEEADCVGGLNVLLMMPPMPSPEDSK